MSQEGHTSARGLMGGLRVLDLTDLRGALAGRLLADLGADVIHIETPFFERADDTAAATLFRRAGQILERIDVSRLAGRRRLDELLEGADVLLENLRPQFRSDLGLDPEELALRHPGLVQVAMSDFGLGGPRSGWELAPLAAFASSGAHFASGFRDRPPCALRGYLAHDCAAVFAAIGAVAGVIHRRITGVGQLVDISVQESAISGLVPWSIPVADYVHLLPDLPVDGQRNAEGAHIVLRAADGWVRVMTSSLSHWLGFLSLCGHPKALTDDMWLSPGFRRDNADVVKLVVADLLTDRTRAELVEQAAKVDATLGAIHRPSEFIDHPQTRSRSLFHEFEGALIAAAPFTVDGTRPPVAAPRRGSVEWSTRSPWRRPESATSMPPRPVLEGIRVIEFGVAVVAPECSYMLSELGADVIKVESATRPDVLRLRGGGLPNASYTYNAECSGRRNVALDLSTKEGRRIALDLCAAADVIVENFRHGTMDALGLGPDQVRAVNPSVVYASSQGYGRTGPMARTPSWGQLNSCFSGIHYLWNYPDAEYPCGTSVNHPDHIAGKWLALLVIAALERRIRSGLGAQVELAQTEAGAFLIGDVFTEVSLLGRDPEPVGNRSEHAYPHDVYAAAGEDCWLAIVCVDSGSFTRLASVVGLTVREGWKDLGTRVRDRDVIDAAIEGWTSARDPAMAAEVLQEVGVSAMPVMGPADHRADPQLACRDFLVALENPHVGTEHHVGNPIRTSALVLRTAGPAPAIGQDTVEVLSEVLGMDAQEIVRLGRDGVCR